MVARPKNQPTAHDRWPVRPVPMPDELLSSLVNRAAYANGMSAWSLHHALMYADGGERLGRVGFLTHAHGLKTARALGDRFDIMPPTWLVGVIAERLGIEEERLEAMTLVRRRGGACPDALSRVLAAGWGAIRPDIDGVVPTESAYMQFCPACLAEDVDPCFRRVWRTHLAVCCERHGLVLETACQVCGHAVRPHVVDAHCRQSDCGNCGFDLRRTDRRAAPREMADRQRDVMAILSRASDVPHPDVGRRMPIGSDMVMTAVAVMRGTAPMSAIAAAADGAMSRSLMDGLRHRTFPPRGCPVFDGRDRLAAAVRLNCSGIDESHHARAAHPIRPRRNPPQREAVAGSTEAFAE